MSELDALRDYLDDEQVLRHSASDEDVSQGAAHMVQQGDLPLSTYFDLVGKSYRRFTEQAVSHLVAAAACLEAREDVRWIYDEVTQSELERLTALIAWRADCVERLPVHLQGDCESLVQRPAGDAVER